MNKELVLADLQMIFRSVFNAPHLIINIQTSQADIDSWDSLNHAILIDQVEKHFKVKFDLMDMLNIHSVGDICDKIIERTEKQ